MSENKKDNLVYISAIILGAILFVAVYGINVLNPLYDDWLMKRVDLAQHYLGWCFYRKGSWTFPIGLTETLAYPTKTSVIFTDSIPVFAVIFKLLSPLLPETFQYFGWWGIICFMLQGFFAAKILRELEVGRLQTIVGTVFFVLSPMVLEKMFRHTALGSHWIILASIYLFVRHKNDYSNIVKTSVLWGITGMLVASIHLYYIPMCGMFLGGYVLCSFIKEKRIRLRFLFPGVTFLAGLLGCTWILGGFSTGTSVEGDGLGEYSFNLNGFFNEKGYSRIFNALPTYKDGQYEGFAYLGLGIFILMAVALIYAAVRIARKKEKVSGDFVIYGIMYLLMSAGLILFAASPEVSFNDKLLFEYPHSSTLYHYWGIFRSTGRIVWPVCYLIYMGVIVCNDRLWKKYFKNEYIAFALVAVCVCAQIFDLSKKLAEPKKIYDNVIYESELKSDIWGKLSETDSIEHLIWVSNNFENGEIIEFARYADNNNWTMSNFYFARGVNVRENTRESMNNLSDSCVYIFSEEDPTDYDLYLYEADGYTVGTTFPLE